MNLFKFNKIIDEKEYTTYLRTFENYRWYKPILVLALGALINLH